jgi:hypothetical protein
MPGLDAVATKAVPLLVSGTLTLAEPAVAESTRRTI